MINNVTISQDRYNDLKLKADLCVRFKKSAEDALDVAREAQEMAGRLLDDNIKLAEENAMLKGMIEGKAVVDGLINSIEESKKEEKVFTNAEKYKYEMKWLEEACSGGHTGLGFSLAVLKDSDKPANCYDISCDDCAFCRFDDKSPYSTMGCSECREYWLQQPAEVEVPDVKILSKADEELGSFADFICHNCDGCRMLKKPADKEDK